MNRLILTKDRNVLDTKLLLLPVLHRLGAVFVAKLTGKLRLTYFLVMATTHLSVISGNTVQKYLFSYGLQK